jgi:HD-GYP domain-containing protein (c-di-GMP phosphodiesterase class II)
MELLRKVSLLHDIGKIGVREEVLNKNGALTPEEREEIKTHSFLGYQIVQPVEFLGKGRDVLLYHQERYDGGGYPAGLKGDTIPIGARMLAIVDSYDAMVSDRPYRNKFPVNVALDEIERCSGTQFDPKLVRIFVKMIREKIQ